MSSGQLKRQDQEVGWALEGDKNIRWRIVTLRLTTIFEYSWYIILYPSIISRK